MRFAVVMFGGVSLAIYINGVAQELLRLVRATAPAQPAGAGPESTTPLVPHAELEGTEKVYRQLGQLVSVERVRRSPPEPSDDIRTRFVIDIVSGTSAGGINGIFLAKALTQGLALSELKRLWVDEGDIAKLINDERSLAGTHVRLRKPPASLLNGDRLYVRALEALARMKPPRGPRGVVGGTSTLVDELDLFVTTTDIRGHARPLKLYDKQIEERRFRHVFRFVYGSAYARGEERDDFAKAFDPVLAFAARSTSSFPFAFEPAALADLRNILAAREFDEYRDSQDFAAPPWPQFFAPYADGAPGDPPPYVRRAFGDGGYLDNKPFGWATQTVARRSADRPVDRRVFYIEPDPSPPRIEADPGEKPNAVENVAAAAMTIPRAETIRDDLQALIERNREIGRIEEVAERVQDALDASPGEPLNRTQRAAHQRLRDAVTLDDVADAIADVVGLSTDTDEVTAVRCLLQAFYERFVYAGLRLPLENTDVRYRMRRVRALKLRVDRAIVDARGAEAAAVVEELAELRKQLSRTSVDLRVLARAARNDIAEAARAAYVAVGEKHGLAALLDRSRGRRETVLRAWEKLETARGLYGAAAAVFRSLATGLGPNLADVDAALEAAVDARTQAARAAAAGYPRVIAQGIDRISACATLFERYDSLMLPLGYGVGGEGDEVEVIRISPHDATSLIDEERDPIRRKLGGTSIHHFGGFFKRGWRRNDIMWGRLDAAERIIDTILGVDARDEQRRAAVDTDLLATRDALLETAQLAILREELHDGDQTDLQGFLVEGLLDASKRTRWRRFWDWYWKRPRRTVADAAEDYIGRNRAVARERAVATMDASALRDFLATSFSVERAMDGRATFHALGRAVRVTGQILDGISDARGAAVWKWIARLGSLIIELVEASTPRSIRALLWSRWLARLLVVGIVLLAAGLVFHAEGVTTVGGVLVAGVLAVRIVMWATRDLLRGFMGRFWFLGGVVGLLLLAAAIVELVYHGVDDVTSAAAWFWDELNDAWQ